MANTKALCANIKMLISDVDGVLTDGSVYKGANGEELKRFNVTDGAGSAIARTAGLKLALISGRYSEATAVRAAKMDAMRNLLEAKHGLNDDEIAYIGDDLIDLVIMEQVAVPIAVANAYAPVKEQAIHVTEKSGGHGAFREALEWILAEQGRLEEVLLAIRNEVQNPPETDPYH